jgi:hypothetical protein
VLRGEKGNDARARHRLAEIRDQVAEVVLFLSAHGAVGEHHAHVLPRDRADGVIEVDPGVDAFARSELRPRGRSLTEITESRVRDPRKEVAPDAPSLAGLFSL